MKTSFTFVDVKVNFEIQNKILPQITWEREGGRERESEEFV